MKALIVTASRVFDYVSKHYSACRARKERISERICIYIYIYIYRSIRGTEKLVQFFICTYTELTGTTHVLHIKSVYGKLERS